MTQSLNGPGRAPRYASKLLVPRQLEDVRQLHRNGAFTHAPDAMQATAAMFPTGRTAVTRHATPALQWGFAAGCIILVLEILFSGARFVDGQLADALVAMSRGEMPNLPADRQFYLESLLPNAIGMGFALLGLKGLSLQMAVWGTGLLALCGTSWFGIRHGHITPVAFLLFLMFSRLGDTLSLWQGKVYDPYFLAFLMGGTLIPNVWVATTALVLAGFCHPILALICYSGVISVKWLLGEQVSKLQVLAVLLGVGVARVIIATEFPDARDRIAFLGTGAADIMRSGLRYCLITVVSCVILPLAGLFVARSDFGLGYLRTHRSVGPAGFVGLVVILSCFLTLDHTRVAVLASFGALLLVYARSGPFIRIVNGQMVFAVCSLFVARLAIPHVSGQGLHLFDWASYFHTIRDMLRSVAG